MFRGTSCSYFGEDQFESWELMGSYSAWAARTTDLPLNSGDVVSWSNDSFWMWGSVPQVPPVPITIEENAGIWTGSGPYQVASWKFYVNGDMEHWENQIDISIDTVRIIPIANPIFGLDYDEDGTLTDNDYYAFVADFTSTPWENTTGIDWNRDGIITASDRTSFVRERATALGYL